ncbi:class I SAM-dependent methyltransferase [Pseudomonas sp. LFM046]|uniref:class I SAM-dependent methyltransferase n=1 Tax=Pseudomonas sp. LFM046 TaxID=1608357 RepID=UPI000698AD88|nr:class I SAM-dependent methyltransferase [Pseudomonas sp. LFM046]
MDPRRKEYLSTEVHYTEESLRIGEHYVMHEWERPLIRRMVENLKITSTDHVLEIGFGLGISATLLQQFRPVTHTIVEPHPQVLEQARQWQGERNGVHLRQGYWQQLGSDSTHFTAIFFDPFCDDMAAVDDENISFLEFASRTLLAEDGRLAMFCIHPFLPLDYQRAMFAHYRQVEIGVVQVEPRDTADPTDKWSGRMISVVLYK